MGRHLGYPSSSHLCVWPPSAAPDAAPFLTDRTQQSRQSERGFRVANIKSQIKRNRQNEQRRQRNKAVKSSLKTYVRNFREAAESGDADTAVTAMRHACRELDKAASKGVIHKKQAANRKSAIARRAAELQRG
jgi:small subunit ribosomal protein S20